MILKRAKDYENDKKKVREQKKNKYKELSEEEKNIKNIENTEKTNILICLKKTNKN